MKIVSISTIKNEADIIESFIRYHDKIFDLMIFLDNGSTDDTNYILEELKKEGLPIEVIIDKNKYFEPKEKYNFLLKKAFNEYNADIVCPLDGDEFITSNNGNPRHLIEKLPPKSYFTVYWKTYVPTESDDLNELFVPSRIRFARDETIEELGKIIISKDLFEYYNAGLSIGNHELEVNDNDKKEITNIKDSELRIAHFPLRSINHTIAKVLTNYPNSLARKVVKKDTSHHYTIMFNKIKQTGSLEMNDVTEFAKNYSLRHNRGRNEFKDMQIELYNDPVDLSFCEDIEIKYKFTENVLGVLLENNLYFANEIHDFKNKISNYENIIKEQKIEINDLIENIIYNSENKTINVNSSSKKEKILDKILSKSNSFNYYKKNCEKLAVMNKKLSAMNKKLYEKNKKINKGKNILKKKNKILKVDKKNLIKKNKRINNEKNRIMHEKEIIMRQNDEYNQRLDKLVDTLENHASFNQSINNELKYAFVFNDSINESEWLKYKDFSLIHSAANYSFIYDIYRILNDAQPKNILELGLGQTSKLTTQYAKYYQDIKLDILEGDSDWINTFSEKLELTDNVKIHHMDMESFECFETESIKFKDVLNIIQENKYDLIIIDGPQGFINKSDKNELLTYSRTNIWELIPNNLAENFIIIIDDYERKGETNTMSHVKELLKENDIEFYTYTSQGLKTQHIIFTEKYKFIGWI